MMFSRNVVQGMVACYMGMFIFNYWSMWITNFTSIMWAKLNRRMLKSSAQTELIRTGSLVPMS